MFTDISTSDSIFQVSERLPGLLLWLKGLDLTFRDSNSIFAKAFGFKQKNECIGTNDYHLPCKAREVADEFRAADKKVIVTKKPIKTLDVIVLPNEKRTVISAVKMPYWENGDITGVLGYGMDITDIFTQLSYFVINDKHTARKNEQITLIIGFNDIGYKLTARQEECLFYLLRGKTAKEIGLILKIHYRTVEDYINKIKLQFGCRTRSELIMFAIENGLLYRIPESLIKKQTSS